MMPRERLESRIVQMPPSEGEVVFRPAPPRENFLGTFDLTSSPSMAFAGNAAATAAFGRALNQWEAFIADPILITIDVDFDATLPSDVLAAATPSAFFLPYNFVRDRIVMDSSSEADDTIVMSLPTQPQSTFDVPVGFDLSGDLEITKANLKAIGIAGLDNAFGVSDGTIRFNPAITYDFDNSDGVTVGSTDFETVAAHEIGHILGFISAVDVVEEVLESGTPLDPDDPIAISPTTFDLYRFEDGTPNDPSTALGFTNAARSLVPGAVDVFDQVLPGPGLTELPLADGQVNQASHFQDGLNLGALDPSFAVGEVVTVGVNDVRVLDLIGYDITIAIPEPGMASFVMLLVGPALLRRRRAG